jgi:hypothetical protein
MKTEPPSSHADAPMAGPASVRLPARPLRLPAAWPGRLLAGAALALVLPACQWTPVPPAVSGAAAVTVSRAAQAPLDPMRRPRYASFAAERASGDVRYIANWAVDSGDNERLPFVIIDKKNTRVFVFDPHGKLLGAAPVLLGAARGDDSVAGIGTRPLAEVLPEEKTTPAGRFMGEPGLNASGEDIVWVDYDAAVSMHRVRTANAKERRLQRLASPGTQDNRISFGCINMPAAFYDNVLSPQFKARYGVVYVLPDVKRLGEVFASAYDPAARYRSALTTASGRKLQASGKGATARL